MVYVCYLKSIIVEKDVSKMMIHHVYHYHSPNNLHWVGGIFLQGLISSFAKIIQWSNWIQIERPSKFTTKNQCLFANRYVLTSNITATWYEQWLDCLLNNSIKLTTKTHQSPALLKLCEGNPTVTSRFPSGKRFCHKVSMKMHSRWRMD